MIQESLEASLGGGPLSFLPLLSNMGRGQPVEPFIGHTLPVFLSSPRHRELNVSIELFV